MTPGEVFEHYHFDHMYIGIRPAERGSDGKYSVAADSPIIYSNCFIGGIFIF
jgi:hypothetical protein